MKLYLNEMMLLQNEQHIIPDEFISLRGMVSGVSRNRRRSNDYDEKGFRNNVGSNQNPIVRFSHTGVWHRGDGSVYKPPVVGQ